jgi:hypothetical protein
MSNLANALAQRCAEYLRVGPPANMTSYVPGSLTEIIIAHGARSQPLDPELTEIAHLIVDDTEDYSRTADETIKAYLRRGHDLVADVLAAQNDVA